MAQKVGQLFTARRLGCLGRFRAECLGVVLLEGGLMCWHLPWQVHLSVLSRG